jgi:type 1 fimbriae regulatory protein FimB
MARQIVEFPQVPRAAAETVAPRTVRGRERMVHLSPEELLAVLKTARKRSARDWAMILIAYRHGLRASELCGLKSADVDLKSASIDIRRLKGSLHTIQPLYRHKGQPLLDEVLALRAWLKARKPDGSDYLFLSQKGGRISRIQFYRVFQACAEAAGLPARKRHPHALKHSLATHLISENVNLAWVKQCLGHKAIGSTMKYVAVSDWQAAEGAQAALMRLF